jgi:protein O-mannosyl-transferase
MVARPNANSPAPPRGAWSNTPVVCLLLVAATLAVYWPVRQFEFLNYDDMDGIARNPVIRAGLSWPGVAWAFQNWHLGNWQPLTSLSHMLDCQLFGLRPGPPHLVNLSLHLANTILLFLLLQRITRARWRSAFVAALFALHPLHVESVAWVTERKDVLSTFFFLLTLLAYARYVEVRSLKSKVLSLESKVGGASHTLHASRFTFHPSRFYILSLLFFALGLMSKPMLVTLPFVLLLLDYWPLNRIAECGVRNAEFPDASAPALSLRPHSGFRIRYSALALEKLPFVALSVAMSWITLIAQQRSGAVAELSVLPLDARVANAFVSCVRYIQKMLWPQGLIAYYPRVLSWPAWKVGGAAMLVIVVTFLAIRLARRRPYLPFGWFWFLGTLVPVIGLVQVGMQAMADRYTYIPLIGLFVAVAWGLADLWAEKHLPRLGLGLAAGAALVGCLVMTRVQVQHWRNSVTLFRHALAVLPGVPLALNNLGSGLYDRGRFEEAVPPLQEALRLKPGYVDAHNNLGLTFWHLGRDQLAIDSFTAVLNQGPDVKAYYNLGVVLFNQGKLDQAKECFAAVLRLQPDSAEAHNNLGNVLGSQGKMDEAGEQFAAAVRAAPDLVEAQCNLGRYFTDKGAPEKAIECYTAALRLKTDYSEARSGLAKVLEQVGKLPEAAGHYTEAIRLQPNLAEAHNNLSNIAARQKDDQTALTHGLAALRLKPDWPEAHFNVANALVLQNKLPEAQTQYSEALRLKPDYLEAHQNLGFVLEKTGNDKDAAEHYAAVVKLRPDFAAAYNRLAVVLARQSKFDEAIKALEEGIKLAAASGQTELAKHWQENLRRLQSGQKPEE